MSLPELGALAAKAAQLNEALQAKSSALDTFRIEPNVKNLGTVTSVSTESAIVTFSYPTDASLVMTEFGYVVFNGLSTYAYNTMSALSSGDTVEFGSWSSTDGNPTSITVSSVSGDASYFTVNFSSSSSNFDEFSAQPSTGGTWSLSGFNTNVVTDNSNLALSQTYFEIGDLTPFVSADATVSSGTITLAGDLSSSISAGMSVSEKSYSSTGPKYVQYNLASGEYEDAKFASPSEFVANFSATSTRPFNSTTNYVWGVTLIEFPPDWVEWVVDVDYELNLIANEAATNLAYLRLNWLPNPTAVTVGTMVTLNESNTNASQSGEHIIHNASDIVGFSYEVLQVTAVTGVVGMRDGYSLPYIRHSNRDPFKVTTAAIYGFFDPRYNGSVSAPRATVSVRRVK